MTVDNETPDGGVTITEAGQVPVKKPVVLVCVSEGKPKAILLNALRVKLPDYNIVQTAPQDAYDRMQWSAAGKQDEKVALLIVDKHGDPSRLITKQLLREGVYAHLYSNGAPTYSADLLDAARSLRRDDPRAKPIQIAMVDNGKKLPPAMLNRPGIIEYCQPENKMNELVAGIAKQLGGPEITG